MKKLLSLLFVLVFGVVLAGCGNKAPKYSINKNVKLDETLNIEEEVKIFEDARKNLEDTKKATASFTYTIDSGEYKAVDGQSKRFYLNVRIDVIIDETENGLEFATGYKGDGKLYVDGKKTERYVFDGTNFVKDGINYINTYTQTIKKVNGNEVANVEREHYKENFDKLHVVFDVVPTSVSEIKLMFLEYTTLAHASESECGKVGKHTTILQTKKTEDKEKLGQARIVLDTTSLTYLGAILKNDKVAKVVVEKQFDLGRAEINYPKFDSYKEKGQE